VAYKSFVAVVLAAFLVAAAGNRNTEKARESPAGPSKNDSPQTIDLRWNFGEKKTFSYNYAETLKMDIKGDSDVMGAESFEKNTKVETSGTITIESTGQNKAEFDIDLEINEVSDGFDRGPSFAPEEEPMKRKTNVTGTVTQDGTMELEEKNVAARTAVQSMMDKLYVMPSDPKVSPGDSWEKDLDYLTRTDASASGKVKTTFLGWKEKDGARYADFESNMIIEVEQTQGDAEQTTTITGTGTWRFDPSEGKLVESDLAYTLELEMRIEIPPGQRPEDPGATITFTAKGEGEAHLKESAL